MSPIHPQQALALVCATIRPSPGIAGCPPQKAGLFSDELETLARKRERKVHAAYRPCLRAIRVSLAAKCTAKSTRPVPAVTDPCADPSGIANSPGCARTPAAVRSTAARTFL